LAARRPSLATADRKLDLDLVADGELVELLAPITRRLEDDRLRVLRVVCGLEHELALAEPVGDLLGLEDAVNLACDLDAHCHCSLSGHCRWFELVLVSSGRRFWCLRRVFDLLRALLARRLHARAVFLRQ